MARRWINASNLMQQVRGCALAGALIGFAGCTTIDPVFAHRFESCMDNWLSQERDVRKKVNPLGIEKTEFCAQWARQGQGVGVLTATAAKAPAPTKDEEG